jgi:hypothetical protein
MTNRHSIRYSKLSIGLAFALAAAPVFAQNTTSAMGGVITSGSNQPVAGAEVTITHVESGSVSRATTDASGRYAARGLRVGGPYTVTITKDGQTTTREGVYLELAETGNVSAVLGEKAQVLDAVQVVSEGGGSEVFSAMSMGAGTSINRDQIENFASIQRNIQDVARIDPRLSQTDKERGEISAGGQNTRFNSVTVDGVTINDTFGLEANNLPTQKQPISIDAIQAVQVNIANYDVTQKGYTGANINAVTKSGTNDFKGSVYYVFRNENLSGDRFNRTTGAYTDAPAFDEDTKGFTFGGPIIKDTLFFFAGYEELNSSRGTPEFGPIGSPLTNVQISPTFIANARGVGSTTWGIDIGSDALIGDTELIVKDKLLKVDANLGEKHRMSVRWNKTEQTDPIFPGFGTRSLSLNSHWYNQGKTIETYVGQLFSDWTDNFSTEFKASYRDYFSEPTNNSNLPQVTLSIPQGTNTALGTRTLISGTERSRHFNELGTETWNYYLAGNLFVGDHELKFGVDYDDNEVFNAFLQDTKGQYTFGCINSSAAVVYTDAAIPGGAVNCSTSTAAVIEAAVIENFRRGRPTSYQVQVPNAGLTLNDAAAVWDYQNLGLFVQDTWSVNYNLTLNFGVRFDQKQMNDSPLFNAAAAAAVVPGTITGVTNPQTGTVTRATGGFGIRNDVTLDGKSLIQPRFGFNYTFDSDLKAQLRGGFGLFEGAAANVWLSNPYSNTGISTRIVGCGVTGFGACPAGVTIFSPNPGTQPTTSPPLPAGTTPAANVDFLSNELEQPAVWKANLAFEKELNLGDMVFSAEWVHTDVDSAIYYKHLNLGNATRTGVDGRELFYTPAGYNASCWTSAGATNTTPAGCNTLRSRALSNASFNNVLIAEKTSKGGGNSFTVGLSRPLKNSWSWGLYYTYTTQTEVSPLTSSVANSNFNSRAIFNPNEEVEANSAYLVKDRFVGTFEWRHAFFGDNLTKFAVFYEGRKGKPYSWIYNNDLNGDGVTNDLLYIPTAPGSGEVIFSNAATVGGNDASVEAAFWQIVNQNGLNRYAGGVVERNSDTAPWTNSFDIAITQELPGFMDSHKASIKLDLLNFGNLLNKKWGRIDEIAFAGGGGVSRSFVNYRGLDASGRYIYSLSSVEDFVTRQARGESQWAAQVTLKYEF